MSRKTSVEEDSPRKESDSYLSYFLQERGLNNRLRDDFSLNWDSSSTRECAVYIFH
jgi:hypothetical protein